MKQREHIAALVEKFLDGRTTNAEERELYAWFRSAEVPEEWQELKAMFAWYDEGMPEKQQQQPTKRTPRRQWIGWAIGSAAVVTIAIVTLLNTQPQPVNIYEGSFIVHNGIRHDDIDNIESDIEAMLARADSFEREADELLAWADI